MLSAIAIATDHVFNPDGTRYLRGAYAFIEGVNSRFYYSEWPFYDVLIGVTSRLTTLKPLHAAYVLNAFMQAAACVAFVRLYALSQGSRSTNYWPAILTVLLISGFNNSRDEIIRDHGYILFSLTGLILLLKFLHQSGYINLVLCISSLILAFLFRVEGLVLIAAAPSIALIYHGLNHAGTRSASLLALPCFIGILVLSIAFFLELLPEGRMDQLWHQTKLILFAGEYTKAANILQTTVMSQHSGLKASYWFLAGGSVALIIQTIISCLSAFAVIALSSGLFFKKKCKDTLNKEKRVILFVILFCLTYLTIYVALYRFCATRYVFLICLLLAIFAAQNVQHIFSSGRFKDYIKSTISAFSLFALLSIQHSGILRGDGKAYIIDAAEKAKSAAQDYESIYTNHYYIDYATEFRSKFFRLRNESAIKILEKMDNSRSTEDILLALYVRKTLDPLLAKGLTERGFHLIDRFNHKNRFVDLYVLRHQSDQPSEF